MEPINPDATYLTTPQVAERLGVSVRRVQALIHAGRLPSIQIGRDHIIKESDLSLVAERKSGRPTKFGIYGPAYSQARTLPDWKRLPASRQEAELIRKIEEENRGKNAKLPLPEGEEEKLTLARRIIDELEKAAGKASVASEIEEKAKSVGAKKTRASKKARTRKGSGKK